MSVHDLPAINAMLNGLSAGLILLGWWQIKHGRQRAHIVAMGCALISSSLFLVCYLVYHFKVTAITRFEGHGLARISYLVMLTSHVLLAFATVPLVIATVAAALGGRFEIHRRRAHWTLPIWLYVSLTGVMIYLVLYHFTLTSALLESLRLIR